MSTPIFLYAMTVTATYIECFDPLVEPFLHAFCHDAASTPGTEIVLDATSAEGIFLIGRISKPLFDLVLE
jgi:hypothetical protein